MIDLTIEEKKTINSLKRLSKSWPKSLWLFSASGSLCIMRCDNNGEKVMLGGGIDPSCVIAPIVKEMINFATEKHFILNIWDMCFSNDMLGKPSYTYNVMSDTDIIAIWAFSKATNCPESDMIIYDKGIIVDKLYGMEVAYYSFIPIDK